MLFNSLDYLVFIVFAFVVYWFFFEKNLKAQNLFLLVISYGFYSWWDYRFLLLLLFSTLLDFVTGLKMAGSLTPGRKKFWFWTSVLINLGFLGFFKYYNFFVDSLTYALARTGVDINPWTLQIILPIGISFYTFHGLSYVVDIYRNRIEPAKNFVEYAVFVSFFPLLVAGPIERATHLLPQIQRPRVFQYKFASDGMRLILWGLFKKVVIADNCASFVNAIFANYSEASRGQLILGAVFFAAQIYGDFSGYSDMARGSAQLLGIELLTNFRTPYFARDIAEFWRRWHISLTTWFRDYVYVPLGGSKTGRWLSVRNTVIVFLISGFWHGANWTFILWGAINALYFLPLLLFDQNRKHLNSVAQSSWLPSLTELAQMATTFSLTCFAWIFFRSDTVTDAFRYLGYIVAPAPGPGLTKINIGTDLLMMLCAILIFFEWIFRHEATPFANLQRYRFLRYATYTIVIFCIVFYGAYFDPQSFIYFQF